MRLLFSAMILWMSVCPSVVSLELSAKIAQSNLKSPGINDSGDQVNTLEASLSANIENREMHEVLELAEKAGIELTPEDLVDLQDKFFCGVATDFFKAALAINLDKDVLKALFYPENPIYKKIPFKRDTGEIVLVDAWRIQHSTARGPSKGGIRFDRGITRATVRALATDMVWKTAGVDIPLGGAKGAVCLDNLDNLTKGETERISREYVNWMRMQSKRVIHPDYDVPAGDVGTGSAHMGYMRSEYEWAEGYAPGVITGKYPDNGGSLGRDQATGQGVCFIAREAVRVFGEKLGIGSDMSQCSYSIAGFGKVGFFAFKLFYEDFNCKKLYYISDVSGGLKLPDMTDDLMAALEKHYRDGKLLKDFQYEGVSHITCDDVLEANVDILVPAAKQNMITMKNVSKIKAKIDVEGANGPITPDATKELSKMGCVCIPDFLSNAGRVTVSYFEMLQNAEGKQWTIEQVEAMLEKRMVSAFNKLMQGANLDTPEKVKAMSISKLDLKFEALKLSIMKVAYAYAARDPGMKEKYLHKMPFDSKFILGPDTYQELNMVVTNGDYESGMKADRNEKMRDELAMTDEIIKKFDGKGGVILIAGPSSVGKAWLAKNLSKHLLGQNKKSERLHLGYHDKKDIFRLLRKGVIIPKPSELAYYDYKKSTLELAGDAILIVEGMDSFSEDVVKELADMNVPCYKVFMHVAPSMSMKDGIPLTSLNERLMLEILDEYGTNGSLPDETLLKLIRTNFREKELKVLFPMLTKAEARVEGFSPYDLPIIKREIWGLLEQSWANMSVEMQGGLDKDEKGKSEMDEVKRLLYKMMSQLEPIMAAPAEAEIPEGSYIEQFMIRNKYNAQPQQARQTENYIANAQ